MKRYSAYFIGLILLLGAGYFFLPQEKKFVLGGPRVMIGDTSFSVEVAKTQEEQSRGLGYRDSLCETCGMLFIFPRLDRYGFWMKGMRFPLDILWIRDGKITHIERDVDFRDQQKVYSPREPADRVLELNADTCRRKGIHEGDIVLFENIVGL